jgi:DNA polymerase-1
MFKRCLKYRPGAPADRDTTIIQLSREQFKACALAVQYGMGAKSLAALIGWPVIVAKERLRLHRETYRVFWAWSDAALDYALLLLCQKAKLSSCIPS